MKTLKEFITEHLVKESKGSSITFNFDGIDGADELIKSLEDCEEVSIDGKSVSISVTEQNVSKIAAAKDIIAQAITAQRNGSRSTNDEQYAQKVSGLESKMKELENAIAELQADDSKEETPEADKVAEKDADKADDKKDDDKE